MDKIKLTSLEKKWVLYDVGNSAFVMLVATVFPIYFGVLATQGGLTAAQRLSSWGFAASISTIIIALLGPILGSIADTRGYKKKLFLVFLLLGVGACLVLGWLNHWMWFLVVFVLAQVGFTGSIIFNDAMLTDVSEPERMDSVSSHGFAWGYIGSCIPFIAGLLFVIGGDLMGADTSTLFGLPVNVAMSIAFSITAIWWFAMTVPLLKSYKQRYYVNRTKGVIRSSFIRLGNTLKNVRQEKHIFVFLLAYFFYINGVNTIIIMATAFGDALYLDSTGLLLALLLTQLVAFPSVLIWLKVSKKISPVTVITICIVGYLAIAIYAYFLQTLTQFFILAVAVGIFQGAIQALSRSYFARIIPAEKAGEYFGLYDIFGKGASLLGTLLIAVLALLTNDNLNLSVSSISIVFLIGLIIFRKAVKLNRQRLAQQEEQTEKP